MKKMDCKIRFLTFLLCLWSQSLIGQTLQFIPDSNAYWNTSYFIWGSPYHLPPYGVVGDTIIGEYNYFQIRESLNDTVWESDNSTFLCGVRQSDNKWMFVFENDTAEYMLYDFGASVGDILDIENPYSEQSDLTQIFEIDSIFLNNEWRRRIGVGPAMGGFIMEYWIEGIGSTQGLYTNINQAFDVGIALTCFTENDTLVYLHPTASSCFYQGVSVNELEAGDGPLIYPNPAKNLSVVVSKGRMMIISEIGLYNMQGKPIEFFFGLNSNRVELDLSHVPVGMYYLNVIYSNGSSEIGKLLKYSEH